MDVLRPKHTVALEAVRYDVQTGLVPVIVQDMEQNVILMQAYANREALKRTIATGQAWFWSRSRQEYWRKGATSGNIQFVEDIWLDCDGDSVIYRVRTRGPACHTGEDTCFYRQVARGRQHTARDEQPSTKLEEHTSATVEGTLINSDFSSLETLWTTVVARQQDPVSGSYTNFLFTHGVDKIAKKFGEEAVEVVIAAKNAEMCDKGRAELAAESADLLYHLCVLWANAGLEPKDVFAVLDARKSKD